MHEDDNIIVEFIAMGKTVKVTAIDPVSLREVSIVGARSAGRKALSDLAVRKLRYVQKRDRNKNEGC